MSVNYEEFIAIVRDCFNEFPVIEGIIGKDGEEYILRQHSVSDVEDYRRFYNMPEIKPFLPDGLVFKTNEEALAELEYRRGNFFKKETIYWCIAHKKSNKLMGGCGFLEWSRFNRRIEIAYDIMPQHQGKGIISQAIKHLTAFAMLRLRVVRLGATTPTDNLRSIGVLTKNCGFAFEGTLQSYKFWKGRYIDVNHFSITLPRFIELAEQNFYSFVTPADIEKAKQFYTQCYNK